MTLSSLSIRAAVRVAVAGCVLALSACGSGGALKAAGEPCVASSECDVGLTCDFNAAAPVCSTQQGQAPPPVDAAPGGDGQAVDAPPSPVDAPPPPVDAPPPPVDAL